MGAQVKYQDFLCELKTRISQSRQAIARVVNVELVLLYWDLGEMILQQLAKRPWGSGVVTRLAEDLQASFPEVKGFSKRNLSYMQQFAQQWPDRVIVQQLVAQLPWGHNVLILQEVAEVDDRLWYIRKALEEGWSRNVLAHHIEQRLRWRMRPGELTHNFAHTLPPVISELAHGVLKDPYVFDYLRFDVASNEREVEAGLVAHIQQFLLELGSGFAFVGKQVPVRVGGEEFHLDLLFYHTRLHCYIVVELKAESFRPEHVGQIVFYLSAVDAQVRMPADGPTIGLILCKTKNKVVAEYALTDIAKPIGVSEYRLGSQVPPEVGELLPSREILEKGLAEFSRK